MDWHSFYMIDINLSFIKYQFNSDLRTAEGEMVYSVHVKIGSTV